MIGLGSNRLSVCRRGGMSVTQAGRGGMEWLAGGRMPSWANPYLPYSKAAGEALKAQFPTQWPTIRDYGFAHPEIVPYVNEDYLVVCSFGLPGMPIRVARVDGTAYALTDIVADQDTFFSFNGKINATKASGSEKWQTLFASDISVQNRAYGIWANDTNGGTLFEYNNAFSGYTQTIATNRRFYAEMNKNKAYVQYIGESSHLVDYNGNYGTFTTPSVIPLFKSFRNGSVMSYDCGLIGDCECVKAKKGNTERWYIPYKKEGVLELRDLETGNYATRVGTFTEAFYLPDGTPWTPAS